MFLNSVVVKADIEQWTVGFRGPCQMTQNWLSPGGGAFPGGMRYPDWDQLRISPEIDASGNMIPGTRRVHITLEDDDPDPMYSLAFRDHGVVWPDATYSDW